MFAFGAPRGSLDLARGVHALICRTLVIKAGKVTDPVYTVSSRQLGNALASGFEGVARPIFSDAIDGLVDQWTFETPKEQIAEDLAVQVGHHLSALGEEQAAAIQPRLEATLGAVYRLGKEEITAPIGIDAAFDVPDAAALKGLENMGTVWITDGYGPQTSGAISSSLATRAVEALKAGHARGELAELLKADLGGTFDRTDTYWRGLAGTVLTRSRSFGAIQALEESGVRRYEYVNPLDERTSDVCRALDGKTFEVRDAVKLRNRLLTTTDPEEWKAIAPWPKVSEIHGDDGAVLPSAELAKRGILMPPLHFHCRSAIQLVFSTDDDLPDLPVIPPEELPSVPEEVAPPPPIVGFPFRPEQLTAPSVQPSVGGMHEKAILYGPDGSKWLFKPVHEGEEFRGDAEQIVAQLAGLVGHPTAEVWTTTLPAGHPGLASMPGASRTRRPVYGSVQRWVDGVEGDLTGIGLKGLTKPALGQIQRQHAFDWLVGDHDAHRENVLRTTDGLLGIDKGQAFKFFGQDRLDWKYNPNPPAFAPVA